MRSGTDGRRTQTAADCKMENGKWVQYSIHTNLRWSAQEIRVRPAGQCDREVEAETVT
jgi:hypothetical protein